MLDALDVAAHVGADRAWVYEHRDELGARQLGSGPKARLRFSLEDVDRAIACFVSRESEQSLGGVVEPVRRRRHGRALGTTVALLPVRGQESADSRRSAA
jgi:hypothetical protein